MQFKWVHCMVCDLYLNKAVPFLFKPTAVNLTRKITRAQSCSIFWKSFAVGLLIIRSINKKFFQVHFTQAGPWCPVGQVVHSTTYAVIGSSPAQRDGHLRPCAFQPQSRADWWPWPFFVSTIAQWLVFISAHSPTPQSAQLTYIS